MDDDTRLSRTNEKKLLMTNKNKKIVCCMHILMHILMVLLEIILN